MAVTEKSTKVAGSPLQSELDAIRVELSLNKAMNENSPINILLANTDLEITYVNPSSEKTLKTLEHLLPVKASEMMGQNIDIFHKDPAYQRRILGNDKNLPHRSIIGVGDEHLDLLVSASYDSEGTYLGPMVTWEVVTEKIKQEEKNADFAGQIAGISASQAVIEFEMDGTIIKANDNFLSTVGYELKDIVGQHHSLFVGSEEKVSSEYKKFWDNLNQGIAQTGEFKRYGNGGKEVWIQAYYTPIKDLNGKAFKVVKYASDITEAIATRTEAVAKAAILENTPMNILLADLDGQITYMNPSSMKTLKSIESILPCPAEEIVGGSYDMFHKNPAHQRKLLGDPRNLPHVTEIEIGGEYLKLAAAAIYDERGEYTGPMVAWDLITESKRAEAREAENQLRDRQAAEKLRDKVDQLLSVVNAAANGDLTQEVTVTGDDAVGELATGLGKMITDLREIIGQVVEGAAQFTEGSRVIAESAQTLAQGSQTQSASVEEMSASIEELTRSIEAVKDNAGEANTVAKETSDLAEEGGSAVQKSVEAMDLIKTSSEQISEIIQVISEIASQTNLLALNAAIEAARAGEHGLGFAVVADEVRKLAERSSEAAKEISSLIKESTQRVEDGATLSEQTGAALEKIIQGVEGTANKIAEIAEATVEQAANATEVANAIQSISAVTEESAAGSEEMASSSEELGAQAAGLSELVSKFKTGNE